MSSSLFFHLIVTVVRLENGPDATVNIDVLKSAPAKVPAVRTGNWVTRVTCSSLPVWRQFADCRG